jgi:hypothetical protein
VLQQVEKGTDSAVPLRAGKKALALREQARLVSQEKRTHVEQQRKIH